VEKNPRYLWYLFYILGRCHYISTSTGVGMVLTISAANRYYMEAFQFITSFLLSFILVYLVGISSLVAFFKLFFKVEHGNSFNAGGKN
jgi:hypothetical protein